CGPLTATATPGTDGAVSSNGCTRTQTRTWNVTDACGNTASTSRTATWTSDLTPPTIATTGNPSNGVIPGCNPDPSTINGALGSATFTDNCGPLTATATPGTDGAVSSNGCTRTQTRTWNVTDACGNTASASRTATWTSDVTAPTFA